MNEPIPFQPVDRATGAAQFFSRVQRYKSLLKRRWWILLVSVAIAVGAQTYRLSQTPLTYVSKAQLIVGNRAMVADVNAQGQEENFVGTTIALFKGNLLGARARENVKTNHVDLKPTTVLVEVALAPRTSIFLVQGRGANRDYTQAYINALIDEFLKYREEMRGNTTEDTLRAITTLEKNAQSELVTAQRELQDFRTTNSVAFVEVEAKNAAQRKIDREAELDRAQTELLMLEHVNNVPVSLSTSGDKSPNTANDQELARRQLGVLTAQRADLAVFLKPRHPKMIKLDEQIVSQSNLVHLISNDTKQRVEERRGELQNRIAKLKEIVKDEARNAQESSTRLAVYDAIKGRIETAKSSHGKITSMYESVKIGNQVARENIQVLEPASAGIPDNSAFTKNIVIGCFIGIVFGIGLLFLLDRFDDRPVSFTELTEHFDELVLGQIPQDASRTTRQRRLQPLTANDPRYAYAEAHRNLRSSLIFMATDGARPRTIVVTSAIPGEGKSTVAVNLAVTMAFAGSRVLLIDADMRKGTVHEYFEVNDQPGLADVLSGEMPWEKAVQATNIPNLEVMGRGSFPPNPGELILAGADALLRQVQEHYDFILFDSAPVLAADDTANLAPKVDGTLFVIRAAYTSARLARNGLDVLYQRQVNVMGLVFNSVETRSREYYYFKYPEYYSKRLVQR